MVFNPRVKEQLCWIKCCYNRLCWSHFCQFGKSIYYYQNGVHLILFEKLCYEIHGHTPMAHLGSIEACIIHTCFYKWTSCFGTSHDVHKMFYVLFHFRMIKSFPYGHSYGSFPMMPHHGHIMFLLHDLCA